MSRNPGRLALAIALVSGIAHSAVESIKQRMGESGALLLGQRMKYDMDNHYRGIRSSRVTGAAAHKRAAKKRNNIRKRSKH